MEKDWLSLDDGEEIMWEGNPRMKSILPTIIFSIPFMLVLIGFVMAAGAYLSVKNTHFVVTNRALYRKSGVLSRSVQKIDFDKVQNISFSQGMFGNYFGYGDVEISTAGGSGVEMRFRSIENPKKVQELINEGARRSETVSSQSSNEAPSDVQREMLDELRRIRKLLEN